MIDGVEIEPPSCSHPSVVMVTTVCTGETDAVGEADGRESRERLHQEGKWH